MGAASTVGAAGHRICHLNIWMPRLLLGAENQDLLFTQLRSVHCLLAKDHEVMGCTCLRIRLPLSCWSLITDVTFTSVILSSHLGLDLYSQEPFYPIMINLANAFHYIEVGVLQEDPLSLDVVIDIKTVKSIDGKRDTIVRVGAGAWATDDPKTKARKAVSSPLLLEKIRIASAPKSRRGRPIPTVALTTASVTTVASNLLLLLLARWSAL